MSEGGRFGTDKATDGQAAAQCHDNGQAGITCPRCWDVPVGLVIPIIIPRSVRPGVPPLSQETATGYSFLDSLYDFEQTMYVKVKLPPTDFPESTFFPKSFVYNTSLHPPLV